MAKIRAILSSLSAVASLILRTLMRVVTRLAAPGAGPSTWCPVSARVSLIDLVLGKTVNELEVGPLRGVAVDSPPSGRVEPRGRPLKSSRARTARRRAASAHPGAPLLELPPHRRERIRRALFGGEIPELLRIFLQVEQLSY